MRTRVPALAIALGCALLSLTAPLSAAADWSDFAELETVVVETRDKDGADRRTTVWIVVLDGVAFLRTGQRSRWGDDLERDPALVLHGGDEARPARAMPLLDPSRRERVVAAFRAKYGFVDRLLNPLRGSAPRIWSLAPAPKLPELFIEPRLQPQRLW